MKRGISSRIWNQIMVFGFLILFSHSFAQTTVVFNYTGGSQSWVVPACVYDITVVAAGAEGGGNQIQAGTGAGGDGAVVTATIPVNPGDNITMIVGGAGGCGNNSGGYNGGGTGWTSNNGNNNYNSCGGGGSTDLLVNGNPIIIAAGGGGSGGGSVTTNFGGNGGCATGVDGGDTFGEGGFGASQTTGGASGYPWIGTPGTPNPTSGSVGQGGNGGMWQTASGGGGGGGYYGGGGGGNDGCCTGGNGGGGGGGGSSLIPAGAGCSNGSNTGNGFVSITYNQSAPVATASNSGPYCAGDDIQLSSTGTGTISWTGPNGFTSSSQNPTISASTVAMSGTYTVTIDQSGCVATASTDVIVNAVPDVLPISDLVFCDGDNSGAINFSSNYAGTSYTWQNDNTGTGLAASGNGSITGFNTINSGGSAITSNVIVTPSLGSCIGATESFIITVNPNPVVDAGSDQTVCEGISVTLSGSGAISYSWDNGIVDGVPFIQSPGTITYLVTGTDVNGCTNTDQVDVTVNALPLVNAGADQSVCEGVTVVLSGSGASTYNWDNGVTDGVAFVQAPGTITYTVIGTDGNGCSNMDQVDIIVSAFPVVDAGTDQEVCEGTSIVLNGSGAISYTWDNGVVDGVSFIPSIGATTYTVTGTSGAGCTNTDQVNVIVNPLPVVDAGSDQTVCEGVSVTLSGTGASTYVWDNGVLDGVSFIQSPGMNTYTVIGTDVNGCANTDQVNVMVNALPTVNGGPDQTVCENIAVTLSGSGASTYIWDNGAMDGVPFVQSPGSTTYTVTGTDVNGCTNTDQVVVTVSAFPVVDAGVDQEVCEGFTVTLNGSGAISYTWDNGVTDGVSFVPIVGTTTYTVTGTSGAGCTNTDQVDVTVNPLPVVNAGSDQEVCEGIAVTLSGSGATSYSWDNGVTNGVAFVQNPGLITYTVTGTDGNGCVNTDQVDVSVNALPLVNAGADQIVCEGVAITLSGSGAASYLWNNGVNDGVSFIQNPGVTTYIVTGTDVNGCVNTDQVQVTVNANPIPVITGDQSYCTGTSAYIYTTNTYTTYLWSTSQITSAINVTVANNPITVQVWDANGCTSISSPYNVTETNGIYTNDIITICDGDSALVHGNYEFTAGDYIYNSVSAAGCDSIATITLVVNPLPNVYAGTDKYLCEGDGLILFGNGANTYSWDNGVIDGIEFIPAVGTTNFIVTGTDGNGCVSTDTVMVVVSPLPVVNAGPDLTICQGESVTLSGSGASTYSWDNGIQNGVSFMPNSTLVYTVTGTDAQGCVNQDNVLVTVNAIPIVDAGIDQYLCFGSSTSLNASGATNYTWDNGVVNGTSFNPSVGSTVYTVIGETNGCTETDQVTIVVNPEIVVSFYGTELAGCAPLTTSIMNNSASVDQVQWTVSNGSSSSNSSGFELDLQNAGCYDVTLTLTDNGCSNSLTYEDYICVDSNPIADFEASSYVISELDPSIDFLNTSSGATSFEWDFGNGDISYGIDTSIVYPSEPGSYEIQLIAYTENGCVDTTWQSVIIYEELIYYIPNTFTPDGDLVNQTFQPVFTSGHDPYDFEMLIFNRWGEVIFETHDPEIGWDGSYGNSTEYSYCPDGTYTWKIAFKVKRHDENVIIHGHVNLIR